MTYEEALAYIHSRPRLPSADSLTRIGVLLDRIGHPERELSFFQYETPPVIFYPIYTGIQYL